MFLFYQYIISIYVHIYLCVYIIYYIYYIYYVIIYYVIYYIIYIIYYVLYMSYIYVCVCINAGPCRVWSGVHCDVSWGLLTIDWYRKALRLGCYEVPGYVLVIYLIKNIHSYLSKVFSEAPLGEHLSHVGARQHDLPCKSVEWLGRGAGFCGVVLLKRQ